MKKVIVVQGKSNTGKTTTIKIIFDQLIKYYSKLININTIIGTWDITVIIEINGIKIGIESQGDICVKGKRMDNSLKFFVEEGCQIILCTSRTKGSTVECIKSLSNNIYDTAWNKKHISVSGSEQKDNEKMANDIFQKIVAIVDAEV